MKKSINVNLVNGNFNLDLFKEGITGYYLKKVKNSRPEFIYLQLGTGDILKIFSTMNDLGGWDEIGSLCIEKINNDDAEIQFFQVGEQWFRIKKISKLILDDDNVRIECGLKLENDCSQVINILPSSFPNAIELDAEFYTGSFDPECDIDDYLEYLYMPCDNSQA